MTSVFVIPWNFAFTIIQGKTYKFRCKFREINILLLGKFQGNLRKIKLKMLSEPCIAISADDTTLYSKWDQASHLWKQLELTFEVESDLRDTMDWDRK